MFTSRLVPLALGITFAWSSATVVWAQRPTADSQVTEEVPEQVEPGEDAPEAGNERPNPFQDPAMQRRMLRSMVTGFGGMGGRGGPGGGRGGPGGGGLSGMVSRSEALRKELGVSDEQLEQIQQAEQKMGERRSEMFRQMREQGNNNQGGNGGRGGNNRGGFNREAMQAMMTQMAQESEKLYGQVLTKDQRARLQQIELRIEGPTAVARPEVAKKLNLNADQYQQVQFILEQMNTAEDQLRQQSFQGMFGNRRGGQGGPGGGGPPGGFNGGPGGGAQGGQGGNFRFNGNAQGGGNNNNPRFNGAQGRGGNAQDAQRGGGDNNGNGPDQGGDNGNGQDRNAARNQFLERMQKMAEDQDKLLAEAEKQIGKVLTSRQKKAFNSMLGANVDLDALAADIGTRGPGGRGGNNNGGRRGGRPAPVNQP